jgi:hypothetical protein
MTTSESKLNLTLKNFIDDPCIIVPIYKIYILKFSASAPRLDECSQIALSRCVDFESRSMVGAILRRTGS